MSDRFEDNRGAIQDLLGPIDAEFPVITAAGTTKLGPVDAVTAITTKAGAVRGNHVHEHTTQWVYVVSGKMLFVTREGAGTDSSVIHVPGDLACEPAGIPHAWKAIEDTTVLVFTRGPRSGQDYEKDTQRLAESDKLL